MIRSLVIDQLRGFDRFQLQNLGTVNLLVGTNNSGKSTVLEAIRLLDSAGIPSCLMEIADRRGEDVLEGNERTGFARFVDVRRLFRGHELKTGNRFEVRAELDRGSQNVAAAIIDHSPPSSNGNAELHIDGGRWEDSDKPRSPFALHLSWHGATQQSFTFMLASNDCLSVESLRRASSRVERGDGAILIASSSLNPEFIIRSFGSIVLTRAEDLVIEALNIVDPSIERLAVADLDRVGPVTTKGGVLVRCKGIDPRIPIGSMGDGIWRMLGIALALVRSEGGILLIDEIDTGLHYSVMADLWRLIYKTARRLNVQVFATTHSRDCCESLAAICREQVGQGSDLTIQRIDHHRKRAIGYTEQEIVAAADRGLEVR